MSASTDSSEASLARLRAREPVRVVAQPVVDHLLGEQRVEHVAAHAQAGRERAGHAPRRCAALLAVGGEEARERDLERDGLRRPGQLDLDRRGLLLEQPRPGAVGGERLLGEDPLLRLGEQVRPVAARGAQVVAAEVEAVVREQLLGALVVERGPLELEEQQLVSTCVRAPAPAGAARRARGRRWRSRSSASRRSPRGRRAPAARRARASRRRARRRRARRPCRRARRRTRRRARWASSSSASTPAAPSPAPSSSGSRSQATPSRSGSATSGAAMAAGGAYGGRRAARPASASGSAARRRGVAARRITAPRAAHHHRARRRAASSRIAPAPWRGAISSSSEPRGRALVDDGRAIAIGNGDRLANARSSALRSARAPDQVVERLPRVVALERLAGVAGDLLEALAHERVEQRLLGREVAVDGADADLRALAPRRRSGRRRPRRRRPRARP